MRTIQLFLFVIMASFSVGCSAPWPKDSARRHARLDVHTSNLTAEEIDNVAVYFGEYRIYAGFLGPSGPGGGKTSMFWERPITTNAIVRWKDARNVQKKQSVNLVGIYEPKFDGTLELMIGPTNVSASFTRINRR